MSKEYQIIGRLRYLDVENQGLMSFSKEHMNCRLHRGALFPLMEI